MKGGDTLTPTELQRGDTSSADASTSLSLDP